LTLCGRLPFEKRRSGSMATGGKGVAAQCVALVSAIFAFAVERGLCADNPARGVRKAPVRKVERSYRASMPASTQPYIDCGTDKP
jgi:hypothetical protein